MAEGLELDALRPLPAHSVILYLACSSAKTERVMTCWAAEALEVEAMAHPRLRKGPQARTQGPGSPPTAFETLYQHSSLGAAEGLPSWAWHGGEEQHPRGYTAGCAAPPCSCLSLGLISNIPIYAISPPTHLSMMPAQMSLSLL